MREHLVLIGNGMAGVRLVEEILERDAERYDITIIGNSHTRITIVSCCPMCCRINDGI